MKKEIIIKTLLISAGIIIFLYVFSYWSSKKYEKQKEFFVNSCTNTFYDSYVYDFNDLMYEFTSELSQGLQDHMGREFGNDYLSIMSSESIKSFCGGIYDIYREELEENKYDYCEQYRCR